MKDLLVNRNRLSPDRCLAGVVDHISAKVFNKTEPVFCRIAGE
jgi:hypothetical protein